MSPKSEISGGLEAVESGEELIRLGAESLASLGGAAAGSFLGPPGALAGAAAGPSVTRALAWAGGAVRKQLISRNEKIRIGTALYVALERIKEREAAGEEPRQDGLFNPDTDPRGMLEGTLLAASRSFDEAKVPYLGAFYASFVFESKLGINEGHYLLNLFDRLTYHELCVLTFFSEVDTADSRVGVEHEAADDEALVMTPLKAVELTRLTTLGLLEAASPDEELEAPEARAGPFESEASVLTKMLSWLVPTDLGETFVRMAELEKIPDSDLEGILAQLRGDRN